MTRKDICIYCMGDYGFKTYYELLENGIKADYFADRDLQKHGYALEGVYCISYEELLLQDRRKVILIVAIQKPEMLISHFRQEGFPYVYDRETAVKVLGNGKVQMKKEPLRDIELIEQMKLDIQKLVYRNEETSQGELKEVMQDYQQRHAGIKG